MQEIGPRFTLKLRWLKRGIPAVRNFGDPPPKPQIEDGNNSDDEAAEKQAEQEYGENKDDNPEEHGDQISTPSVARSTIVPPKEDVYEWQWKVCMYAELLGRNA